MSESDQQQVTFAQCGAVHSESLIERVYECIYIYVYLSVDVRMYVRVFMPRCYRNWQPDKENKTVTYKLPQCQIGKEQRFMSALVVPLFDYGVCIINKIYKYISVYICTYIDRVCIRTV